MMGATWSIAVGTLIFIIALVASIIYYLRYKKIYLITLISSIAVYTFAVFYTWDVFELNKNWVLILLIISTILMIFLGKYSSNLELESINIKHSDKKKNK